MNCSAVTQVVFYVIDTSQNYIKKNRKHIEYIVEFCNFFGCHLGHLVSEPLSLYISHIIGVVNCCSKDVRIQVGLAVVTGETVDT